MSTPQQTQALARVETSPMILELAGDWKISPVTMINTLKATIFKAEVSTEILVSFLQVCNTYKLNPFVKEIYAFPSKGGGFVPMVPIDGWANIINRNQNFDGLEFSDEWETDDKGKKSLFSTTCTIYRKDRTHPIRVTEYMQECYQANKDPWVKWPARMLRHKALIQCARIAFALAGIYDPDEAERIAESGESAKPEIKRPTVIDAKVSSAPAAVQGIEAGAAPAKAEGGSSTAQYQPGSAAPAVKESAPVATEQKGEAKPETAAVEEAPENPGTASPAFDATQKCFCTCCKNLVCDCLSKPEFDRCGCPNCKKYVSLMQEHPEVKAEDRPTSADVASSTPAQSVAAPGKPEGPYVAADKRKRLFAVCASKGWAINKDSHDDPLHKLLKEKFNIDSIAEIPVKMFSEVLNAINPDIKVK